MTVQECIDQGATVIRQKRWANPTDVCRLDRLHDGTYGPWMHFESPSTEKMAREIPDMADMEKHARFDVVWLLDKDTDWEIVEVSDD